MNAGSILSKESLPSESEESSATRDVSEIENSTDIDLSDLKIRDDSSEDQLINDYKNGQKINKVELKKIIDPSKPSNCKPHPVPAKKHVPPRPRNRNQNQYQKNTNGGKSEQQQSVVFGSDTRKIAEWMFASFRDIPLHDRKYVELELKFGTIIDKQTRKRIKLKANTKRIYRDRRSVNFNMLVAETAWADVTTLLEELEHDYKNESKKLKDVTKKKFTTTDIDITDSIYLVHNPGEMSKKVRISKDNKLDRCWGIEKKRIGDLFIHNPSSRYDWRLSLSLEIPATEATVESLLDQTPMFVREKRRNVWADLQTATRYDLTQVLTPRKSKNYAGETTLEKKYEIEVELEAIEVYNAMDKVLNDSNRSLFKKLVGKYLNNARMLNNRITEVAPP